MRADRLGSERLARLWPAAIVLIAALLSLVVWWRRNPRRVGWALAGGAAYLVVFHGYYWGLSRRTYSLSSVLSATEIIVATASATALGLVAAWLVALLGERPGRRGSAGTIAGVGYAVLLTLAVPVLVGVVLGGWTVTWMLPDALPMFLQFFSQLQGLVLALLALVIGGIALLVGRGLDSDQCSPREFLVGDRTSPLFLQRQAPLFPANRGNDRRISSGHVHE